MNFPKHLIKNLQNVFKNVISKIFGSGPICSFIKVTATYIHRQVYVVYIVMYIRNYEYFVCELVFA